MKYLAALFLLLFFIANADAAPPKGFHKGPYFMLQGGIFNFAADNNVRTGAKVGRDYEPAVGFNFGWNLYDWMAPEFQVRYTTNKNNGNREHVVKANFNFVYSLITDSLADRESIRLIPFLQSGPMLLLAAVPGDPTSSDKILSLWGPGIGVGGGLRVLYKRYVYFGLLAQSDFVVLPDRHQNVGGVNTKIIDGSMDAQFGATGTIGVHF
ncbi:MAG: hypothetical protein HYU98_06610 [Deltaproteobacteria bacterium]|nr:hypothetical protein [Deltaproteobacteria bacterium]